MQAKKPTSYAEFLAQRKRYSKIDRRDSKIAALAAENSPEARKARRAMNDQVVPKQAPSLVGFYNGPKGCAKVRTRATCDAQRINTKLRHAGVSR